MEKEEMTYDRLRNYRRAKRIHDTLLKRREHLYNTYHSPSFESSGSFSSDPHSPVETAVVRIEEMDRKITQIGIDMLEVEKWIYSIEDRAVLDIAVAYVIDGKSFGKIARQNNQAEQSVRNTYYSFMRKNLKNKQNSTN